MPSSPSSGFSGPPPRLLRELRIAFTFLLITAASAGALCGSESVVAAIGNRIVGRARIVKTRLGRFKCALPARSSRTTWCSAGFQNPSRARRNQSLLLPGAAPPSSAVAPKARVVRIRRPEESPAIARLPLGRTQSPAPVSAPDDRPLASTRYLGARCGTGQVNRGRLPDTGRSIGCKRATVQCPAEKGAEDKSPCEPSSQRDRER